MANEGYEASLLSFDAGRYVKVVHVWWKPLIDVD